MPRKRSNKSAWVGDRSTAQPSFKANVKRQRRRAKTAKLSRRKNRSN